MIIIYIYICIICSFACNVVMIHEHARTAVVNYRCVYTCDSMAHYRTVSRRRITANSPQLLRGRFSRGQVSSTRFANQFPYLVSLINGNGHFCGGLRGESSWVRGQVDGRQWQV